MTVQQSKTLTVNLAVALAPAGSFNTHKHVTTQTWCTFGVRGLTLAARAVPPWPAVEEAATPLSMRSALSCGAACSNSGALCCSCALPLLLLVRAE